MCDSVKTGFAICTLALAALACNAFAGRQENTLPPPPAVTVTSLVPVDGGTETPVLAPTSTLPGDPTPLPAEGTVRVVVDLNVRSGPGVQYDRVGFMLAGEAAAVLGRDGPSGWWKIVCPPRAEGDACWVSGGPQFTRLEE